ncbi:MAG: glycosyltransferase family 4 protein [Chitinispirillaceae bacterium]|nr:glycosyltransferase family 4 protein [Chitinispirillaceae bacterium]
MNGINIIGYISADCGLGVAARATVRLLTELDYAVTIADIKLSENRSTADHPFSHLLLPDNTALPRGIRFFHLNPPVIGTILEEKPGWFGSDPALCVAVPFWELPVLPDFWKKDLQAMDVVLCPSHFIMETVAATALDPVPQIRHYPQTVFLPGNHRSDRVRFGLPEKGVCFVLSFEMASDAERKNPWAALDAFNMAFSDREEAYLVIKINRTFSIPYIERQLELLRRYRETNSHILIYDQDMSYEEVISLYESCDVYLSLHRSEGLGLGLMESMFLERPVIATAWSGNMDFMNDQNSCLVGYRLVPVRSPIYLNLLGGKSALWADPRIEEAAVWMRRLYEQPDLRRKKGMQAQKDMVARQVLCRRGETFAMVGEMAAARRNDPSRHTTTPLPETTTKMIFHSDQARLISSVAALLKENDAAAAIALYDGSRKQMYDTPELLQFDELMRRLREKVVNCSP